MGNFTQELMENAAPTNAAFGKFMDGELMESSFRKQLLMRSLIIQKTKTVLLFLFFGLLAQSGWGQSNGDYRTATASVAWGTAANWQTWDGAKWVVASLPPSASNSVYVQVGHTVTLSGSVSCKDLFISTGTTSNSVGGDGLVALAANELSINGKLATYYGASNTIANSTLALSVTVDNTPPGTPITKTAASAGKIKFVGSSNRTLIASGEWGANATAATTLFSIEFAMDANVTGTVANNIKVSSITVSSGILDIVATTVGLDNSINNQGDFTISAGATVISSGSSSNIFQKSGNGVAGTLTVSGTLILTGAAPKFQMNAYDFTNGTVQYSLAGNQTFASRGSSGTFPGNYPLTYNNVVLSGSGTKTTLASQTTTINGTLSLQGTAALAIGTTGALAYGSSSTLEYASSTGNQTTTSVEFPASSASAAPNLKINNTFTNGTVTLNGAKSISGKLTLTNGSLVNSSSSNITLASGATISRSDGTLAVAPTFDAGGVNITYTGSTADVTTGAEIPSTASILKTLTINEATKNVIMDRDINVNTSITITSGTLTINPAKTLTIAGNGDFGGKSVTLKSDATGTAAIGQITGTLSNASNVTVERYIPALRKYRFFASPVVGGTALQWRDGAPSSANANRGIQITGTNGSSNNFDVSTNNANSAFSYDETVAGSATTVGTGSSNDPGWTAFTNGNMALTNGAGYRVLVRGDRTMSLIGGSAVANITTISVTGTNPSSPVTINVTHTGVNSNSGFNFVGNPFPSAISWAGITKNNVDVAYYTYSPSTGAYVSYNGSTGSATDIISSSQGFFVVANAATGSIVVPESAKSSSAGGSYFKTSLKNHLKLTLTFDSTNYDDQYIHFRTDATNTFDNHADAYHLTNSGINFSSTDGKGIKYSINSLADFTEDTEVQLNIENTVKANYTLSINGLNSFDGAQIFLRDKLKNNLTAIDKENFQIVITHDTLSDLIATSRFSVVFKKSTTGINNLNNTASKQFSLFPNPASSAIYLAANFKDASNNAYTIYNQLGMDMQNGNFETLQNTTHAINIEALSAGIYFIKITNDKGTQVIRFVK